MSIEKRSSYRVRYRDSSGSEKRSKAFKQRDEADRFKTRLKSRATVEEHRAYRVRYRDPSGHPRSSPTFESLEDARHWERQLGGQLARGDWLDPAGGRTTFTECADRWWSTTGELAPSTRRGYRGLLDRHVLPYFGGRKLSAIDVAMVRDFAEDRRQAGLGPKSRRDAISIVKLVIDVAVEDGARRDNPAAGFKVKKGGGRKVREGDVLDMAQVHQLVEATRDPYKPAIWILALTGLRPAELCGLRVRDVDFTRGVLTVRRTLMPVHRFADPSAGAGESRYRMVEGPPKTDAGNRSIPLPRWLVDELAAMLAARGHVADDRDAWLFQTRYGNPLNRDHFREKVVRPALRAAGLPETIRNYDLRHGHASLLFAAGANHLEVAQRMGHTDPSITLRVYGHLFEGTQDRLTEQLDALRAATATLPSPARVVPLPQRATRV